MTTLSFIITNDEMEQTILTQPNTTLVGVGNTIIETANHGLTDEVRIYGISNTSTVNTPKTDEHKILFVPTGRTIDTLGFDVRYIGNCAMHTKTVYHVFEVMN